MNYIQKKSANFAYQSSPETLSFDSPNTEGNTIIAVVSGDYAVDGTVTVHDSLNSGNYDSVIAEIESSYGSGAFVFRKDNVAAGANTITLAWPNSGRVGITIYELPALGTADQVHGDNAQNSPPFTTSRTTAHDDEFCVAALGLSTAYHPTITSGNPFADDNSTNGWAQASYSKATAGSVTVSWDCYGGSMSAIAMATFPAAGGGGGSSAPKQPAVCIME